MKDKPRRTSSPPSLPSDESSARTTDSRTLVDRIRAILAARNLTLYGIATRTRQRHPHVRAYHLPTNFYFQLSSAAWTPTIHQISALSELSNYRIADWLHVFGFQLDDISRLQAILPRPRTVVLDSVVYDFHETVPWFRDRASRGPTPPVAPLTQLLKPSGSRPLRSSVEGGSRFAYAKIGQQDAFAFPYLVPGSIVRANPTLVAPGGGTGRRRDPHTLFLVEHRSGFCCCRLHFGDRNRITLLPAQLPFANVELRLGSHVRIIGEVDLEFRPLIGPKASAIRIGMLPEVAPQLSRSWSPGRLAVEASGTQHAHSLRRARLRAGLSLRMASQMSRDVAKALGDDRYFISQASLSDYEANDAPPRHIHKLLTLCVLYALPFRDLLSSFGIDPVSSGATIPKRWMAPGVSLVPESQADLALTNPHSQGFLSHIIDLFDELPLFLRNSFVSLSGLSDVSLRDVFWVGGQPQALHPALAGALFVVVNRRRSTPPVFRPKSLWDQPLYLVLRRDESYLLANCTREDKVLVLHPHAASFVPEQQLRIGVEAEVVGQITAVVRSLVPPASF